ncbi:replication-relaxation family protein [Acidithrix sp. C25]|uniref:replication-relaxation family protein n=1 Tax=Acidithrix sp. C25 TaxID=1671482 RepID=UPI00191BC91C|nr:replication-relaxation family protein [Acidithrix sp. C25]CAG4899995.1 unnamed protein product [Acidithrix sp. C25]
MSASQYGELAQRLSDRDWQILSTVRGFKYLTTRQLARQHFGLSDPAGLIPRTANHALARLRELGLLVSLERRIGGVRAGSGGFVWQITDLANRALCIRHGVPSGARLRTFEPGITFLDHTLAIAEVVITLQETSQGGEVVLKRVQLEPESWRNYLGFAGEQKWLKPDLAAITLTGEFEDHWFIEVDRATEPPGRVVKKCLQYHEYLRTGKEQNEHGLFPAVVWVVPNNRRREQLRQRLANESLIDHRLFTVVMSQELAKLVSLGATEYKKARDDCKEGDEL